MVVGLLLSGCNGVGSKHVKCTDPAVEPLLKESVQKQVEKSLDANLKQLIQQGSIKDLDPAKLKVMAKNLQYKFEDVRTDFIDPDSSKTTCVVSFEATIPANIVKKSDEVRVQYDAKNMAAAALAKDIDLSDNNKVSSNLSFVLHPTDDGKKIFLDFNNFVDVKTLLSETLVYAFIQPQVEKNQISNARVQEAVVPVDAEPTENYDYGE